MNKQGLLETIKDLIRGSKVTDFVQTPARHFGSGALLVGLLLAVLASAGCASTPTSDATYNPITDYPAAGSHRWHL